MGWLCESRLITGCKLGGIPQSSPVVASRQGHPIGLSLLIVSESIL